MFDLEGKGHGVIFVKRNLNDKLKLTLWKVPYYTELNQTVFQLASTLDLVARTIRSDGIDILLTFLRPLQTQVFTD